jgi:acetyltransferase-like isoleucine patch superfamily enzyme
VFINRGCYFHVRDAVSIGDHCMLGEYVSIHDENHRPSTDGTPLRACGYTTAPVRIGSNVWIGAKASILAGTTIGDNAVIGANAVVTHDIPGNSIAVGVPARVIRTLDARPAASATLAFCEQPSDGTPAMSARHTHMLA